VIVDFHPVKQDLDYGPDAIVKNINSALFGAYCQMLARTAGMLEGLHTDRVALELMNEPPVGWNPTGYAQWQSMLETAYAAARQASPHLILILSGGDGGNAEGLINLSAGPFARDRAAIFTFHYYQPYDFTMQSLSSDATRRVEVDVPYPSNRRSLEDSLAALKALETKWNASSGDEAEDLARAMAVLTVYHAKGFDRQTIHATFDEVSDWAKRYHIGPSRILLGEFDATRRYGRYFGARDSERAQWLHDVRQEAELHGFPWSIWAYRGYGGMAIVRDDSTEEIDTQTLNALGLR